MTDSASVYDLAILGGGVNGCGIARDAAGRGLSVCLFEKDDLASGTSSASTKLIHGGLRYLEYYEFRLVREALTEREVLLKLAPHIIWPLRFVLPHAPGLRPAWLIRLGLFLYDHLGGRKILPATKGLDLRADAAGQPLKPGYARAFEYSDCWVMDSRLVALNARAAADLGARIDTRTQVVKAERQGEVWQIETRSTATGETRLTRARALVNAAGPWVGAVLGPVIRAEAPAKVRMVQGSHIVVPKLFDHDRAYIFQNADNRIVFAIPYEGDFTLIGTTDHDWTADPGAVAASAGEVDYLCAAASEYFERPVRRDDVVWSYSGIRPLYDDGASKAQEATRDYVLKLDAPPGAAPLLSVFGGKITTYRRLAEEALERLAGHVTGTARPAGWTAREPLPGGDFAHDGFEALVQDLLQRHAFLPATLARRLVRHYGTKARDMLYGKASLADLGRHFGADLYECEVKYLVGLEWARTAEDILWRRTKLGLRLTAAEAQGLNIWLGLRNSGVD